MKRTFLECIKIGALYEDNVANYYESLGFQVQRVGNYRTPVDLYVSKEDKEFAVQVKFRSNLKYISANFADWEPEIEEELPEGFELLLFIVCKNKIRLQYYKYELERPRTHWNYWKQEIIYKDDMTEYTRNLLFRDRMAKEAANAQM